MDILGFVTRVPLLVFGPERYDDDFADRMNYKYTVAILVIFAIVVTNRQFGQKQIHCWVPAYFTRNYEEYINDICWVSNTYFVSLDEKLPDAEDIRKSTELKYYQWVPFILLLEAFFFYIPNITWRALSRRSGIDLRDLVEAANNFKSVDKYEKREKYMTYMISSIDQYVDDPRRRKEMRHLNKLKRVYKSFCIFFGKFLGNYLVALYITIKLLYISNCLLQIWLLNILLDHPFHKFGIDVLDKIINGKGWDTTSRIFPKISMCDFRIREIGNPKISHRYTVQCVLPINLFNQQIFTFIWFWYIIILVINIYSLLVWLYRFTVFSRLRYVRRRVKISNLDNTNKGFNALEAEETKLEENQVNLINKFVKNYLEPDGAFMLRILSSNVSDFVCAQLIQELWKSFCKNKKFDRVYSTDTDNDDDDDDDDDYDGGDDDGSYDEEGFKKSIQDAIYDESLKYEASLKSNDSGRKLSLNDNHTMERKQTSILKNSIQRVSPPKRSLFKPLFRFNKSKNKYKLNPPMIQSPTNRYQSNYSTANIYKRNSQKNAEINISAQQQQPQSSLITHRQLQAPSSALKTNKYKETEA